MVSWLRYPAPNHSWTNGVQKLAVARDDDDDDDGDNDYDGANDYDGDDAMVLI